jgi:hypothetical protein
MFDFSDDESFCLFAGAVIAVIGIIRFYRPVFSIPLLGRSMTARIALAIVPLIGLGGIAAVLCRWADPQVRGHVDYVLLFLVVGAAWIFAAGWSLRLLGIGIRDDAVDRNNVAATIVAFGMLLAVAIVYALANVGGGPTIWTTFGPAAAATAVLFVVMLLMEVVGGSVAETITLDRDIACGVRMAGAWISCGLVLGRAAGGNWISAHQAAIDLAAFGWPAIMIALAAGIIHRLRRPTPEQPNPSILFSGLVPGLVFMTLGLIVVSLTPHGAHPSQW